MGKYLGEFIIVVITLLALEWFGVVNIPYLELPDFTENKQKIMYKTGDIAENID